MSMFPIDAEAASRGWVEAPAAVEACDCRPARLARPKGAAVDRLRSARRRLDTPVGPERASRGRRAEAGQGRCVVAPVALHVANARRASPRELVATLAGRRLMLLKRGNG